MNYLFHLYLSDRSPHCLLGNIMGDFVKGRIDEAYPPEVRRGLEMHRKVDSFANGNDHFRQSKSRIDPRYGHYKGILIDILYDHLLAKGWHRFAPLPLEEFADYIYRLLEKNRTILPEELRKIVPRMISGNWLLSYREEESIERVLQRLSQRLKRENPLAEGIAELHRNRASLEEDCFLFLADASAYVQGLKAKGVRRKAES